MGRPSRASPPPPRPRIRRALVLCGAGLALAAAAVTAPVQGSPATPAACRDAAPWILTAPADGAAGDGAGAGASGPSLRVATYNVHSGLGLRHSLYRPRAQVERNLRAIARAIAAARAPTSSA